MFDIALVTTILVIALVLFVTEALRMDIVALLVVGALTVTGLVTPAEAVAGFSNEAVITLWAMFIISEGLLRTGVGDLIGRYLMRLAGRNEAALVAVIMLASGGLSAFMNNIGVAVLMLPVVMGLARRARVPPSRMLMPLAFGCLLGGLTTQIGTPPNLLVSAALAEQGDFRFQLFDFLPVGGAALVGGVLFFVLFGRRLLPTREAGEFTRTRSQRNLRALYGLREFMFTVSLSGDSRLAGRTLAESRVAALGLIVIAIERGRRIIRLPARQSALRAGDRLLVQGKREYIEELRAWQEVIGRGETVPANLPLTENLRMVQARVAEGSPLIQNPVNRQELQLKTRGLAIALRRGNDVRRSGLSRQPLRAGDFVLLQGRVETADLARRMEEFDEVTELDQETLERLYRPNERLIGVRVSAGSPLVGLAYGESRLAEALEFRLLAINREDEVNFIPDPDEVLREDDRLLLQTRNEDLETLRAVQELEIEEEMTPALNLYATDRLATEEVTLAPLSRLGGRTAGEMGFNEKYGLELVAIRRAGQTLHTDLQTERLNFGDALLLVGPRNNLRRLARDPSFIEVTPFVPRRPRKRYAGLIMIGVIGAVLTGWLPISIAALIGATLMVLIRCLSMEDAYRAIDWRAVFLIAGMLPLGTALANTGAARLLAGTAVDLLGTLGPWYVIGGLYLVTALATMIVPTAALVVLMSPVVLSASASLGIAPTTAMMAMAMAASASFTSPISHPANILIMGPGNYRFKDYIRAGIPLTLLVFVIVMLLLPIFWPLQPAVS
ncbi:MAG: SLC13 family permease [Gammaproteobacteria bacterium]|nr:SLC13 family permease [Gammaproteobacteria bacterium]MXW45088.1 SLC13 family permease [Gammaproteobacteria bacterium]MYD01606.1 SLC13 family permease [Gammaproteobacteria bacterium]MYI25181.1 SLC13 family permease [Gammaproteobacteria bacterium]